MCVRVEMSAHSLHVHQHFRLPLKWSRGHGVYHMCSEKYSYIFRTFILILRLYINIFFSYLYRDDRDFLIDDILNAKLCCRGEFSL